MLGMIVAAKVRRKTKMTATTSAMHSRSSNSTSATEARTVVVRSVKTAILIAGGIVARSFGSSALMRSTTSMMLAPGWRWMFTITAGTLFIQADSLGVLDAVDDVRHVFQHDRRAVPVGQDELPVVRAGRDLVVGADLVALGRAVEAALGRVEAGRESARCAHPRD